MRISTFALVLLGLSACNTGASTAGGGSGDAGGSASARAAPSVSEVMSSPEHVGDAAGELALKPLAPPARAGDDAVVSPAGRARDAAASARHAHHAAKGRSGSQARDEAAAAAAIPMPGLLGPSGSTPLGVGTSPRTEASDALERLRNVPGMPTVLSPGLPPMGSYPSVAPTMGVGPGNGPSMMPPQPRGY